MRSRRYTSSHFSSSPNPSPPSIHIAFSDVKDPLYTAANPNGRLPTIIDPNMDLTLFESGAIVLYLLETYDDKSHKLIFPAGIREAALARQ